MSSPPGSGGEARGFRPAAKLEGAASLGDGLGSLLLADAVRRAYASAETVGSSMLVVDALSERAAAFYESFGFQPLPESRRLVLPMRSIETLLARDPP